MLVSILVMKRIILLFVFIGLSSLAIAQEKERSTLESGLDFTKYEGFFISTHDYPGMYSTIGLLSFDIMPAKQGRIGHIKPEVILDREILDMAVTEAKKRGADGMVFYKVGIVTLKNEVTWCDAFHVEEYERIINGNVAPSYSLIVRALLIKREE